MYDFPVASEYEKTLGWKLSYQFLDALTKQARDNGCHTSMEDVEIILLMLNDLITD